MDASTNPPNVLVTGAYGLIGNLVYARLAAQPENAEPYAMVRAARPSGRRTERQFFEIPAARLRLAELADLEAVQRAVDGMDVVVHMAANPNGNAAWDSVLSSNIVGAYHIFEASRRAGVRRVVFASTNQVVFGYADDEPYASLFAGSFDSIPAQELRPINEAQAPRPLNYYACSKLFGESLARMYSETHGMSCLCLRIGWVTPDDRVPLPAGRMLWCSQRDIVQLVERCIYAPPDLRYDVFFGQSDNPYNLVDIEHARRVLGYAPQDNAEQRLA